MKTKIRLPEKICSLDIETEITDFKFPENSKLAIAGIKVYNLHSNRYYPCKYNYFLLDKVKELEKFLIEFPGIIIGHNIFQFDYRVLNPLISLDKVIYKTVDTLFFLCEKNERSLWGLGLDNLSRVNFGKGKTIKGNKVSEFWRKGKRNRVIKYNENDCKLTKALWWQLVKNKFVKIKYYEKYKKRKKIKIEKSIFVSNYDISVLTGIRPLFTVEKWNQKLEIFREILNKNKIEVFYEDSEIMYYWFYCIQCKNTYLFEINIDRGYADHIKINCPKCHEQLGKVRSDFGLPHLVGEKEGNYGNGACQGVIPELFQDVVSKYINSKRCVLDKPLSRKIVTLKQCDICNSDLMTKENIYNNPANGLPICSDCFTSGRWLLFLK